jgi:hypothetical protein
MWIVKLVAVSDYKALGDCRKYYFPRKFHYKKDALALAELIARRGGEAEVVKAKGKGG